MNAEPTRRELLTTLTAAAGAAATAGTATDTAAATAQPSEGRWPLFGYDLENTGHNPDASGVPADPGPVWGVGTGGPVQTSPTVLNGRVFVGSTDATVYALDAADGDELWTVETGGPVRSAPAAADGRVYVGSDDGTVYAFDAADGSIDWTFGTDDAVRAAPAVAGGTVYVGSWDNTVYALDAADGSEEWTFETLAEVDAAAAVVTDDQPDPGAPPEGVVYVGSRDGLVYALDAADGSRAWEFPTGEPISGAPAVADGHVYVGSLDGQVYGLTTDGGQQDWRVDTGGAVVTSPAVADGRVYVASRAGTESRVHAIAGGQEEWTFEADGELTSPAVAGGRVYAGSRDGNVYAFDTAGEEQWSFAADQGVQSAPAVAGDAVYVGSDAGTVYALAEGADGPVGGGDDGGAGDGGDDDGATDPDGGIGAGDLQFLLWPASLVTFVAVLVGGLYAAHRAGLLARVEAAADEVDPLFGPAAGASPDDGADGDATATGDGAAGEPTQVWELVIADVIARAEQTDRTATQDLLVTKYVDSGTLDSPVVAYELESFRDDPARVRLVEPRFEGESDGDGGDDGDDSSAPDGSQPLGDDWRVEGERLVFEAVLDPGESLQTLVGRPDCPEGRLDTLLDRPDITVEPETA